MENKELLMKIIAAGLQYGIKVAYIDWDDESASDMEKVSEVYSINKDGYVRLIDCDYEFDVKDVKPYLKSIDSMTADDIIAADKFSTIIWDNKFPTIIWNNNEYKWNNNEYKSVDAMHRHVCSESLYHKWLDMNHYDHDCAIQLGIAIEVTEDNNPYKEDYEG